MRLQNSRPSTPIKADHQVLAHIHSFSVSHSPLYPRPCCVLPGDLFRAKKKFSPKIPDGYYQFSHKIIYRYAEASTKYRLMENKLWYSHVIEYYSEVKRNELSSLKEKHNAKWENPVWKSHPLTDSNYITFKNKQNYRDS